MRPEQSPREKQKLNLRTGSSAQTAAPSSGPTGITLHRAQMPPSLGCPQPCSVRRFPASHPAVEVLSVDKAS